MFFFVWNCMNCTVCCWCVFVFWCFLVAFFCCPGVSQICSPYTSPNTWPHSAIYSAGSNGNKSDDAPPLPVPPPPPAPVSAEADSAAVRFGLEGDSRNGRGWGITLPERVGGLSPHRCFRSHLKSNHRHHHLRARWIVQCLDRKCLGRPCFPPSK